MLVIQFILIIIIGLIVLRLILQLRRKEINSREFLGWLSIWLLALVVILYPGLTSFLAGKVGVGRGVDLVIYSAVILIFYLLFRMLMRVEKIEREITKIVRAQALKDQNKDH